MVQGYMRTATQNEESLARDKSRLAVSIRNEVKNLMKIYSDTDFGYGLISFSYKPRGTVYFLDKKGLEVECKTQSNRVVFRRQVNPDRVPFEKFDVDELVKLGKDIGFATSLYYDLENDVMPMYRGAKSNLSTHPSQ